MEWLASGGTAAVATPILARNVRSCRHSEERGTTSRVDPGIDALLVSRCHGALRSVVLAVGRRGHRRFRTVSPLAYTRRTSNLFSSVALADLCSLRGAARPIPTLRWSRFGLLTDVYFFVGALRARSPGVGLSTHFISESRTFVPR